MKLSGVFVVLVACLIGAPSYADSGFQVAAVYERDDELEGAEDGYGIGAAFKSVERGGRTGYGVSYLAVQHRDDDGNEVRVNSISLDLLYNNTIPGKLDLFLLGGIGTYTGDRDGEFYHVGVGKFGRIGWEFRYLHPHEEDQEYQLQGLLSVGF